MKNNLKNKHTHLYFTNTCIRISISFIPAEQNSIVAYRVVNLRAFLLLVENNRYLDNT